MEQIARQRVLAQKAYEEFCARGTIHQAPPLIKWLQRIVFVFAWVLAVLGALFHGCGEKIPLAAMSPAEKTLLAVFFLLFIVCFVVGFFVNVKDNFGEVAKFTGFHYEDDAALPAMLCAAQEMGFFPQVSTIKHFWTEQNGLMLDMYRVTWSETRGKHTVCFSGYVFSCHMHKRVSGQSILLSDSLLAKYIGKRAGLKRVKLEWLEFEKAFDLFSDDENEVREIFTPDIMAVLYDFCHSLQNDSMCFMFQDNRFSCFYGVGELPHEPKEQIRETFDNLYVMKIWPELLEHKLMAPAWQEKDYVRQRLAADLPTNLPDAQGLTPMMHCILQGDILQFEQYLEETGFNANQVFVKNGSTLLHLAAANNRVEMARRLLAQNPALAEVKNSAGQTALDVARDAVLRK